MSEIILMIMNRNINFIKLLIVKSIHINYKLIIIILLKTLFYMGFD